MASWLVLFWLLVQGPLLLVQVQVEHIPAQVQALLVQVVHRPVLLVQVLHKPVPLAVVQGVVTAVVAVQKQPHLLH